MSVLICWHSEADARAALRRAVPRADDAPLVRTCRTPRGIKPLLDTAVVDAVVLDATAADDEMMKLASDYVSVPFFGYGRLRADDGRAIQRCQAAGFQGVLVEGADDPVLWRLLVNHTASSRRRRLLREAPRLLRLTEDVQQLVWEEVLRRETRPTTTQDIAEGLGLTREYLSRAVGAGGAPNLKRVIDLIRVACAADFLRCGEYGVATVVRLLRWRSVAQLNATARRVAGVGASDLAGLGVRGVLSRFVEGRTRSRP